MTTGATLARPAGASAVPAPHRLRSLRARLVDPMPADGPWGWLAPLAIAVLAGLMRFDRLSTPGTVVFDETYYARDAQKLLRYGVEWDAAKRTADFVVHPPVGKWMIAAGEWIFGNDSLGWRFSVALTGTLSVFMVARIGRRLFRSTLLGCVAGLLMTFDGLHFVHSRTALLDLFLTFWALAAFGCLLIDRDRMRQRLATTTSRYGGRGLVGAAFGPGLGVRPWRIAAGVCLGLACATKWSGVYFLAGFGLMTVLWDVGGRRVAGVGRPFVAALVRDAGPALLSLVGVALLVYLVSWTGWFLGGDKAWDRNYAATVPAPALVPDALWGLWRYHQQIWAFHTNLHAFHPYKSNPWSWLVQGRPTSFFYESPKQGQLGCQVASCSRAITSLGTPAVWWAACAALPITVFQWAGRRDWRAGAILMGVAAGYLPWFFWQQRTIFTFYAIAFEPYLVLAVTMCLGLLIGSSRASPVRRQWGASTAGAYVLLVIVNFWWLLPILSAQTIPYADWLRRMWLRSWI